jgi:MYXO-CTERM domain-containing protein
MVRPYFCCDADGDGHDVAGCAGDDCDDCDPTVYTGALEICDGKDNDCDGNTDEGGVCPEPDGGDGGDGGGGGDGGMTIQGSCSCSASAPGAGACLLLGLVLVAWRRRRS